ncbi:MAG: hypothetical protein IJB47_08000 [Oscillospiraceae bacterium]|nr:hypothetical protein [Oscillospiraceae bacterium]MBQ4642532.1 hypothetical protein [Oscillospiraceae bacterium]
MSEFLDWLGLKSKQQRKEEARKYDLWAFPYGPEQKKVVIRLLQTLLPEEKPKLALMIYLAGKQGYAGGDPIKDRAPKECSFEKRLYYARWAMENMLRGKYKKLLPRYMALIIADQQVDASLNYPSVEELRQAAMTLEPQLK